MPGRSYFFLPPKQGPCHEEGEVHSRRVGGPRRLGHATKCPAGVEYYRGETADRKAHQSRTGKKITRWIRNLSRLEHHDESQVALSAAIAPKTNPKTNHREHR